MSQIVDGWFCEHHGDVGIGEWAIYMEMYCKANRRCTISPEGCHAVKINDDDPAIQRGPEGFVAARAAWTL